MKILFPVDDGIAYCEPSGLLTIQATALLMVPPGIPFSIVPEEALPSDYTFRDAWAAEFSDPDGYGADYGVGSAWGVIMRDKLGNARSLAKVDSKTGLVLATKSVTTADVRAEVSAVTQDGRARITINIDKAREIAHSIRRQKRAAEFAPLDEIIMKQIPGTDFAAIEAKRETVRQKYADMQIAIDAAETVEDLFGIIGGQSAA